MIDRPSLSPTTSSVVSNAAQKTLLNTARASRGIRRASAGCQLPLLTGMIGFLFVIGPMSRAIAGPAEPVLVASIKTDHSGSAIAFSQDGKTLALTTDDRAGSDGPLVFPEDGRPARATGRPGAVVALWDVETKKVGREFKLADQMASGIVWSPDGKSVGVMTEFSVTIYDPTKQSSRVLCRCVDYPRDGIRAIAYSRDGKYLTTGNFAGEVKLWNIGTGKVLATMAGRGPITDLAFLPDGQTIVGADNPFDSADPRQNGIWLWDVKGKNKARFLNGYRYPVQRLAVSPDGKTVVTPGNQKEIWLWDIDNARLRDKWTVDFNLVHAVTYSRDGRIIVTAGGRGNLPGSRLFPGQVTIWDARTGKRLYTFKALEVTIGKIALSPDRKHLAVSPSEHLLKVNVWDISRVVPNEEGAKK